MSPFQRGNRLASPVPSHPSPGRSKLFHLKFPSGLIAWVSFSQCLHLSKSSAVFEHDIDHLETTHMRTVRLLPHVPGGSPHSPGWSGVSVTHVHKWAPSVLVQVIHWHSWGHFFPSWGGSDPLAASWRLCSRVRGVYLACCSPVRQKEQIFPTQSEAKREIYRHWASRVNDGPLDLPDPMSWWLSRLEASRLTMGG